MAYKYASDGIIGAVSLLKKKIDFKRAFILTDSSVKNNLFWATVLLFLFPPVVPFFIARAFLIFYKKFIKDYMENDLQFSSIIKKFSPALSDKCISTIGYRIEYNELDEHLNLIGAEGVKYRHNPLNILFRKKVLKQKNVKAEEDVILKKMIKKQKRMLSIPTRRIGVGIDTLKTHLVVLGQTGSGKTEFLRSLLNDVWKVGGGNIFIDAKAESSMLAQVSTQLKKLGRETSLRVINFLKSEDFAETNTVNFFTVLPPSKTVDFLFRLADTEATADANHQYFQQRGKAMLTPIVYALFARKYFCDEPFSVGRLSQSMNVADLTILYFLIYGMARDINEMIKQNIVLIEFADTIKVIGIEKEFEYIAKLCDYFSLNPFNRKAIENALKVDIIQVYRLYKYAKENIESYLYEIWPPFRKYLPFVADFLFLFIKYYKKEDFFNKHDTMIDYDTFFEYFKKIKIECENIRNENNIEPDSLIQNAVNAINQETDKDFGFTEIKRLVEALATPKMEGGSIHEIPDDAIQQHSYAQQQWTKVFDFFNKYQNIFGRDFSEVSPYDLVLDNQILYVLFSPKEDESNTPTIAKTAFMFADIVASKALGGRKISGKLSIKNIIESKTHPKPVFIIFGDEYNSYALKNVDVNFLQFRSLNISMILAAQTQSGLQPGKTDKVGMENIMFSSSKYILGTKDTELYEYIKKMLGEEEVFENKMIVDETGRLVKTSTVDKTKKGFFDPDKLGKFKKGFGIFFKIDDKGQDIEDIIFMQSLYRGGEPSEIKVNNFIKV